MSLAADVLLYFGVVMLCGAVMLSRGLRALAIGVVAAPLVLLLFIISPREIAMILIATSLTGWIWFSSMLTRQQGERAVYFLLKVFAVWIALVAAAVVLNPLGKYGAAILVWTINGAWLIWYLLVGPNPHDPWRWGRDRDGTWRA